MESEPDRIKSNKKFMSPYTKRNNYNLKKLTITSNRKGGLSSYKKKIFNKRTINGFSMKKTISDCFYYKNPFFYNDNNLNLQLKILKKLRKIDQPYNSTYTSSNTNNNTKYTSTASLDQYFNINKDDKEKIISRNKLSRVDINSNISFPSISQFKTTIDNNNIKEEINDINCKNNQEDKINPQKIYQSIGMNTAMNKEKKEKNFYTFRSIPQKKKENDEFMYRLIFRKKPLFKSEQKIIIDNKYNMIYAENEYQYKKKIEKYYDKLLSEGKKIKSKNLAPSTNIKLDETKKRIEFMKGIMDFSYPGFVLSKIKNMQKILNEKKIKEKNSNDINNAPSYLNCFNGMEKSIKEQNERSRVRKEYLLKSLTIIK